MGKSPAPGRSRTGSRRIRPEETRPPHRSRHRPLPRRPGHRGRAGGPLGTILTRHHVSSGNMRFLTHSAIAGLSLGFTTCESWRFTAPADELAIRTPGTWSAAAAGNEGRISTGWLAE